LMCARGGIWKPCAVRGTTPHCRHDEIDGTG
jgi:hypothetical protein